MRVPFPVVCMALLAGCTALVEPPVLEDDFFFYLNEQSMTFPPQVQQRFDSIRAHPVSISVHLIQFHNLTTIASQLQLRFYLPEVGRVVADAIRIERPDSANVAWSGVLQESQSPIFFVVVDGDVGGMIHTERDVFSIKPLGDGYHVLVKLDQSKFGPDDPLGADSNR